MSYDLAIIGAGWAGFNAAKLARDSGLKVALIEKGQLGGNCLNRGCIPTKALIQSAKIYSQLKKAKTFGIDCPALSVDFNAVCARKDSLVTHLRQGMQSMLSGIDFINSEAEIISPNYLKAGAKEITAKFILIASGSRPAEIPGLEFDGKKIISSDDALLLKQIPESLLIIGGGVIGCEFASLFSALGSNVTMVEKMANLLPGMDIEASRKLENIFKKKGIKTATNTDAKTLNFNDYKIVLICVGRAAEIKIPGLEKIGVKAGQKKIIVDAYLRTNIPNIFACGDCVSHLMLAHFAAYQGSIAAGNIAHPENLIKADISAVPSCIFTDPEIAAVGISQDEAQNSGLDIKVNKFDFLGSGMARILDETEGFIKIISDKFSGVILGAVIIGPRATELISPLTVACANKLTLRQLKETILPHPTLSEAIHDAIA
ncbi:MAG: dihydrolipoyl dehydrogenase [Candidatus Omnitrophota bacterium]